jgi:hypothetical protein
MTYEKKYFPDPEPDSELEPTKNINGWECEFHHKYDNDCDECKDLQEADNRKLNDQWKGGSTNIRPSYYAKYKIDPWTFCIENNVNLPVGSVIKYIMRFQEKNGEEDLNKAIKCIEMMKEYYYGKS